MLVQKSGAALVEPQAVEDIGVGTGGQGRTNLGGMTQVASWIF